MTLCISVVSVSTYFSFLILLIWSFSFSWWVWLVVCQFCLSSSQKNKVLVLLIFAIVSFISFSLFLLWSLWFLSFCWLWGFFCSSFSSCFRYRVRLSVQCFSCFLRYDCIAINFPLRTAFAESHRFWVAVFSFSFVSRNLLISFLIL